MNKYAPVLLVAGSLGAGVAFFLPFFAPGWFSAGPSMLYLAKHPGMGSYAFFWSEPFHAALVLIFGVLAPRLGKVAVFWSLGSALLGLVFLVGTVIFFARLPAQTGAPGLQPEVGLGAVLPLLASGYWLAAAGFLFAAGGAALGLTPPRTQEAREMFLPRGPEPGNTVTWQPATVLALVGGGAAIVACFLPITAQFGAAPSLLELMWEGSVVTITWLWPVPVGASLLLVAGGLALWRGTVPARWYLSSAGVGLAFLLVLFLLMGVAAGTLTAPLAELSVGYWLAVVGFLAGGIGVLLPGRHRPALAVSAA